MLTWTIFQLSKNPGVLEKVKSEGKHVFAAESGTGRAKPVDGADCFQSSKLPDKEELSKLSYTVNALKETLRMYWLVPMVTRECVNDDVIGGNKVPAGSKIFINIKTTHLNEKLWPEPDEYRPERFEEKFDPCVTRLPRACPNILCACHNTLCFLPWY